MTDIDAVIAKAIAPEMGITWAAKDFTETSNGCGPDDDRAHCLHLAKTAKAALTAQGLAIVPVGKTVSGKLDHLDFEKGTVTFVVPFVPGVGWSSGEYHICKAPNTPDYTGEQR